MSLLDALLLEGHRDTREVYISLRGDGVLGSGRMDDPYDGSTIKSAPLAITSLSTPNMDNPLEAVAVTAAAHGYADGDLVTISGAGANGDWWDGTFEVYQAQAPADPATVFRYLMRPEAKGSLPLADPKGRVAQKILDYRFDERMRELPANATVHIGPGVFETRGQAEGQDSLPLRGWLPQDGQRILGAGMGLTTLKLVGAVIPQRKHAAISTGDFRDGLEVENLTVDCNLDGQPSPLCLHRGADSRPGSQPSSGAPSAGHQLRQSRA